jgi:hypothetical protein
MEDKYAKNRDRSEPVQGWNVVKGGSPVYGLAHYDTLARADADMLDGIRDCSSLDTTG